MAANGRSHATSPAQYYYACEKDLMNDRADRQQIRALLEASGLNVESVPETRSRRCDLRASDTQDHYLFEIKGIYDDEVTRTTIQRGDVYANDRLVAVAGPIADAIDEAVRQLRETSDGRDELRLVALIDHGRIWSGVIMEQIVATLYGIRTIAELTAGGVTRKCVYFAHGAFQRKRISSGPGAISAIELDGAIIVGKEGAGLCVNHHSPNALRLCESTLGRHFDGFGLLHTAMRMEHVGGFLVADCDIDRRNESAMLRYLKQKYSLTRPVAMRSVRWAGAFKFI